ncbi:MAG: Signal transduction histidine kinase [Clostridiales bacterium]|jgi:signal transduction histidine kinase|nr:Signal transduction histidine kinase [Clostridiales bacterium]
MKKSLSTKLFLLIIAVVLGSIFIVVSINGIMLENYYLKHKNELLVKTFNMTNQYYLTYNEDLYVSIIQLVDKSGFDVATDPDYKKVIFNLESSGLSVNSNNYVEKIYSISDYSQVASLSINEYIIYSRTDPKINTKQLVLFGKLVNGDYLGLSTPYESISDIANVTNLLFIRIGSITALIAAVFVFIISRRFARPILQISKIARDMAELDFTKKYCGDFEDEVGVLGHSINTLSSKLERTISELKTANLMLKEDIQEKQVVDEMRRGFMSNISHELKTPIALIQGYAEGLKDSIVKPEDQEYYYDVILDESEKMGQLVKRIMALMQLEAGQDQIMIRHFDIAQLIEQELEKNQILFEQKDINIVFDCKDPHYVWADELFIEDVIRNYITNAINHVSGEGKIIVSINDLDTRKRITVFNTGQHIPESDIDKIWISFYKVDKARTRKYGGTGIGLAVVSAIMKAHNMPYGVRNVEGGVEFYIELDSGN